MNQLDATLDQYLVKKAPGIPANWQEVLVKFLPWITLVFLILALPPVLFVLGLGTLVLPFSFLAGPTAGFELGFAMIFLIATLVLEALAIPGLFKRKLSAWRLLYYSTLLNAVYSLLSMNIGGLIIGTLLSLYILFQIKHHYS